MEHHLVGAQDFRSQFRHHLSVYGHGTGGDELVSLSSATDTGIGHELIQTDGLIGVDVLFLILYAFLQTVFCVWIVALTVVASTLWTLSVAAPLLSVASAVLVASLSGLSVASTVLITSLSGLVSCMRLIATFHIGIVARTVSLRLSGLIATLHVAFITWTIALLSGLVSLSGLVALCVVVVAWTIALLPWLIAAARLITTLSGGISTLTLLVTHGARAV